MCAGVPDVVVVLDALVGVVAYLGFDTALAWAKGRLDR